MKKKSYDEVKEYIENEGYELISKDYINNQIPLTMKCPEGHICRIAYNNFKTRNRRCSKCYGNRKLTEEEVKELLLDIGYTLKSSYKNAISPIKVVCPKGHTWITCWGKIQNGRRCPYCSGKFTNIIDVRKFIESKGYKLLSNEISTVQDKLTIECKKGHVYQATFNNFKRGNRCPICKESKGEKKIAKLLDTLDIEYITQYSFDDCVYKLKLKYDFYLPKLNTVIEYDGEYHYYRLTNTQKEFENIITRDNIKNLYCRNNDINLIRIPYWEFKNIEKILESELNDNNTNFND